MEPANGPLPSRSPIQTPPDQRADPWGDFLRRVLVAAKPTRNAPSGPESPTSAHLQSARPSQYHGADLPAE